MFEALGTNYWSTVPTKFKWDEAVLLTSAEFAVWVVLYLHPSFLLAILRLSKCLVVKFQYASNGEFHREKNNAFQTLHRLLDNRNTAGVHDCCGLTGWTKTFFSLIFGSHAMKWQRLTNIRWLIRPYLHSNISPRTVLFQHMDLFGFSHIGTQDGFNNLQLLLSSEDPAPGVLLKSYVQGIKLATGQ